MAAPNRRDAMRIDKMVLLAALLAAMNLPQRLEAG
jgi:hypothetical protein